MLFVFAVSRIEKQSCEEAFKQSADDIKCCIYVTFYPYQGVRQSWLWDVGAFDQYN